MPLFGLSVADIEKMKTKKDVKGLTKALTYKKNAAIRLCAARALVNVGDNTAVDGLIVALKDEDDFVKNKAVEALAKINGQLTINKLTAALKDEDPHIRQGAVVTLGLIGDNQVINELVTTLKDENLFVRIDAGFALAKMNDARAADGLIDAIKLQNRNVRKQALDALGKIGNAKAIDGLVVALKDQDVHLRLDAIEAITKIGGEHTVNKLIVMLKHPDPNARLGAARVLGRIGDARAVDALLEALKYQPVAQALNESSARGEAADALGKIGSNKAVDGLVRALKDPSDFVRSYAIGALGKIGDPSAINGLIEIAIDDKWYLRKKATEILHNLGGESQLDNMKLRRCHDSLNNITEKASNLIIEALKIIENYVQLQRGFSIVVGAGQSGPLMEATNKLEEAHKIHPENSLIHYAYASSLFLAMQYKTAREIMEDCSNSHPDFLLAQFALKSWNYPEWQSLFQLPKFGPDTQTVPPAISKTLKTWALFSVRDGVLPRATLFIRDTQKSLNVNALQVAKIALATETMQSITPQIVGVYARIYDNPSNPYTVECPQIPFYPSGHYGRTLFEYFCLQKDMDIIVTDSLDQVLLNKRVPFTTLMNITNKNILARLNSSEGKKYGTLEITNAFQNYQRQVQLSKIKF